MSRLIRLFPAAVLLAAPLLLCLIPRTAHAFCVGCLDLRVNEYVNEFTGRYLLLPASDPEVAIVEQGGAGPGWVRTGNDFTTITIAPLPVCRFYSPGYNAHFYTADAAECAQVKRDSAWIYEKSPFPASAPVGGVCIGVPVFRVYRAGDHRYTADPALRDTMVARGWRDEGVAFCAEFGGREALETVMPAPRRIDSAQACQSAVGDCVALDSLAPMPNLVPPYLPPNYIQPNPAYPTGLDAVVGYPQWVGDLYTSHPSAVLQHSFASLNGAFYLDGHERTAGDYARIAQMAELPGVAGNGADQRLFVWRGASDHELRISAFADVGVVAQDGPGSHAYGGPVLQFGDARTGRSFLVTLQAYGTVPPGDFTAPDARSGEPIVSTVFRPDPAFGRVLNGSFVSCHGDGSPCAPQDPFKLGTPFQFSLQRADFLAALARARTVDGALSPDPTDYFLARVTFSNETYLDARLGVTIVGLYAQVWYVE